MRFELTTTDLDGRGVTEMSKMIPNRPTFHWRQWNVGMLGIILDISVVQLVVPRPSRFVVVSSSLIHVMTTCVIAMPLKCLKWFLTWITFRQRLTLISITFLIIFTLLKFIGDLYLRHKIVKLLTIKTIHVIKYMPIISYTINMYFTYF